MPTTDPVHDADLAVLHRYWAGKCAGRKMPSRRDIDPTEIPSLLPHLFIAEVLHPLRFRFRLVGTAICDRWGENYNGKFLDELSLGGERQAVMRQYALALESAVPRYDSAEFTTDLGRYLNYRRLLLPLSDDGEVPNMLLGAQKAINVDGYQVPLPKWA